MFGTVVEVGDIIISAASREGGYLKLGKVYGFDRAGHPLIKSAGKKYESGKGYYSAWVKGLAGSGVIVLRSTGGGGQLTLPPGPSQGRYHDFQKGPPRPGGGFSWPKNGKGAGGGKGE